MGGAGRGSGRSHRGPKQSLGDLLAEHPWGVQLLEQAGEHCGVEVSGAARAVRCASCGGLRQARQQDTDQANDPRPAMPPRPSDQLHEHGTLHADTGRWMKHHGPQVQERDGRPARRPTAGPSRASGCGPPARRRNVVSSVSSGEGLEQHMAAPRSVRVVQPLSRQTSLTDQLTPLRRLGPGLINWQVRRAVGAGRPWPSGRPGSATGLGLPGPQVWQADGRVGHLCCSAATYGRAWRRAVRVVTAV